MIDDRPALPIAAVCVAAWLAELVLVAVAPAWSTLSHGPLVLAVLAAAAQYGLAWGSAACALCAALRAVEVAWLMRGAGSGAPGVSSEVLAATFLLVVVAGSIGDTWRSRRAAAALAAADAWTLLDRMSGHFTSLLDRNHLLESQVGYLAQAIPTLITHFDELDPAHPEAIPPTLITIARELAGSGEAALYSFRKRRQLGELMASSGPGWSPSLDRDNPVVAAALHRGAHVTLAQVRGVASPGGRPPAGELEVACQLPVEAERGHVVLVMRHLEMVSYAPARLEALERAMKIGGKALSRAHAFVRTRDLNVEDPVTGAVTHAYLEKRLAEHHALGRRHGHVLSLVRVDVARPAGQSRAERRRGARHLADALRKSLRDGDLLALSGQPDRFWILCPFTPREGARVVSGRLCALSDDRASGQLAVEEVEVDPRVTALEATLALVAPPGQRA